MVSLAARCLPVVDVKNANRIVSGSESRLNGSQRNVLAPNLKRRERIRHPLTGR